jgi:hypothetical protein
MVSDILNKVTALGEPELCCDWIRDFTEIALAITILISEKAAKITEGESGLPAMTFVADHLQRFFGTLKISASDPLNVSGARLTKTPL